MRSRKLRLGLFVALCFLLSFLVVLATLPLLLQYRPIQQVVLESILDHCDLGNIRVSFSKARVIFWDPVELAAEEVELWLPRAKEPVKIHRLSARFSLKNLLHSRFGPEALTISGMDIVAPFSPATKVSFSDSMKPIGTLFAVLARANNFSLLRGKVLFPSSPLSLTNITARLHRDNNLRASILNGAATLTRSGQLAFLALTGTIAMDPATSLPRAHIQLSTPKFLLSMLGKTHSFVPDGGELRAEAELDYGGKDLKYSVRLRALQPRFVVKKSRRGKVFQFPYLEISLSGLYGRHGTEIPRFLIKGPEFSLRGTMRSTARAQKTAIDLKVSSVWMNYNTFKQIFPDPLVSPWLSERLFPIISQGTVRVGKFRLKGNLDQIAHLDNPANRSCLSLEILWKQLQALRDSGPFPFDHVSGSLVISDGSLTIDHLRGNYGRSKVSEASVYVPDLYTQIDHISIELKGLVDMSEIPLLTRSPYVASHLPSFLGRIKACNGVVPITIVGNWLPREDRFSMDSGSFRPTRCRIAYDGIDLDVQEATLEFKKGFGYRAKGKVTFGGSSFVLGGRGDDSMSAISVHANGYANIARLVDLFGAQSYLKIDGPDTKPVNLSIEKAPGSLTIECNADIQGLNIKVGTWLAFRGEKENRLFFRINRDLRTKIMAGQAILFQEAGFIESSFRYGVSPALVEAKVQTPRASAQNFEIFLGGRPYRLMAGFSCNLEIKLPLRKPTETNIFGRLDGYGITISQQDSPTLFNNCVIGLSFEGKDIHINCMRTEISGVPVIVSGHFKGWQPLTGQIETQIEQMDLAKLSAWLSALSGPAAPKSSRIFPFKTKIEVDINVADTHYRSLGLGRLTGSLSIRGGNLKIDRCQVSSAHATIALLGYLNKKPEPEYYFGIYIKAKDFPIQDLFRAGGPGKPLIEGNLDMEALLSSQGRQVTNFIKNLSGQANFVISKGKVIKSSVLIKLLDFFSVQKIFVKEPPDLSKQGFYFEEIKGSLDLSKGIIHSDQVVMKSPVFNAILRGKANLINGNIKADLGAQPFVTIDSILSRIPVVGYILTGKERALLVYYFKVRGKIRDPKLSYVPLKNMGRSVLLFLRRAFFTPARLFKNIAKFAKELAKKGKPVPFNGVQGPSH